MPRPLQLLVLVSLVACASNPRPESQAPACSGTPVVVVKNNWDRTIEVFTYSRSGMTRPAGSVRPGSRDEFGLFDSRGVTFGVEGRKGVGLPQAAKSKIETQYFCR